MTAILKYSGSCHCGEVKFEIIAPRKLSVIDCNCSVCTKKKNQHFTVSSSNFKLVTGHTSLTTYTFGTHQAKHMFCSRCGVQSFYIPRSDPGKMGIMPHCLDGPLPLNVRVENVDGLNLELGLKKSKNKRSKSKLSQITHL